MLTTDQFQAFLSSQGVSYFGTLVLLVLGWKMSGGWANAVLVLSCVCLGWSVFQTIPDSRDLVERLLWAAAVVPVTALVLYYTPLWTHDTVTAPTNETGTPSSTPAQGKEPILEPSYELLLMGLPITFPPNSTTHLVKVREGRKVDLASHVNSAPQPYQWPSATVSPPENVGLVQLANHSEFAVFNVEYGFTLRIGKQGDETRVDVKLPLFDLPAAGRRGFFLVNQSEDVALVDLATAAVVRVQGEQNRRAVRLRPRQLTFFDRVPMLMQSAHKWEGDKILNPDSWGAAKKKKKARP